MKMEGRVFALTGEQMLELAELCDDASAYWVSRKGRLASRTAQQAAGVRSATARHWSDYLRREHAAHFGTEGEG
jgi:hypothetical protein